MGLLTYDCEDKRNLFPNRLLVNLYARLGIYRYNLSKVNNNFSFFSVFLINFFLDWLWSLMYILYFVCQGTNLEFHHLKKFNMTNNCISSYRITLVAYDPATTSLVTFLVGISEEEYARSNLMLFIARPQADKPHCQEPVRPIGIRNELKFILSFL